MSSNLKSSILTLLVACSLLGGCNFKFEKTIDDFELQDVAPELVMVSFISPQNDSVSAMVMLSEPIFTSQYQQYQYAPRVVKDAVVTFKDDQGNAIGLSFHDYNPNEYHDAGYGYYSALVPEGMSIEAGKTYFLEATYADKKATASCTIPSAVKANLQLIDTALIVEDRYNQNAFYKYLKCRASWENPPISDGYFSVLGFYKFTTRYYDSSLDSFQVYDNIIQLALSTEVYSNSYLDNILESTEGDSTSRFVYFRHYYYDGTENEKLDRRVILYLKHLDYNYYQYMQTKDNRTNGGAFVEPKEVYSNVEGGYGIFASYYQDSVVLEIE